jgi:hypothetical protein
VSLSYNPVNTGKILSLPSIPKGAQVSKATSRVVTTQERLRELKEKQRKKRRRKRKKGTEKDRTIYQENFGFSRWPGEEKSQKYHC